MSTSLLQKNWEGMDKVVAVAEPPKRLATQTLSSYCDFNSSVQL